MKAAKQQEERHDLVRVHALIDVFRQKYNHADRSVKTQRLIADNNLGYRPQELRDLLGYIRRNDMCDNGFIVSDVHKGYWYTENPAELHDFLNKQLNRCANMFENIEALRNKLIKPRKKHFTGQTALL